MTAGLYDYLLAGILLFVAVQILRARDLLVSIILLIIFGMLVSFAWVRLQAPDIALVEAVIGSALTGALFLASLGQMESRNKSITAAPQQNTAVPNAYQGLLTVLVVLVGGALIGGVWTLPRYTAGLSGPVQAAMPASGVKNPVTAVILNFRGYDTLLEIGVLCLVAIAVFALNDLQPVTSHVRFRPASRVLTAFLHILSPLMIIVAFYLLWAGAAAPGGAFQAGAMLAGVGILMLLGGVNLSINVSNGQLRSLVAIGFGGFFLCGLGVMGAGQSFLEYPEMSAKEIIFFIELLATVSIAIILLVLFAGCSGYLSHSHTNEDRNRRTSA